MPDQETPHVPYPTAMERFPTLRQSYLSSFDRCGLTTKFDLMYRRGWDAHHQARGVIFHRVAARCLREMAVQGERKIEIDVAKAILHEVLRQDDIDRQCPDCFSTKIRPGISPDGNRLCGDCGAVFETELTNIPMSEIKDLYWTTIKWAHENSFDTENLYSTEERYRATLSYPNPHGGVVERVLTGQLDALFLYEYENRATVLDWKDTWALPGPTDLSFGGYFQQRFYGWLVMKNFKQIDSVTLREFYERYSEGREATVTRDQLDDIEAELSALAERFDRAAEEDVYRPSPGNHCSFCVAPTQCPILKEGRMQGRIVDMEDAKRKAGQLIVAEEITKDLRASLRAFADASPTGQIPLKSVKEPKVMGFRRKERVERPTKEELERALANGNVDLDRLYKRKVGTRFEVFSPDDEQEADDELLELLEESVRVAQEQRQVATQR